MSYSDKDSETALLKPQSAWVDGGRPAAAGSAAGPWRTGGAPRSDAAPKLAPGASRFDTSIGGRSWREEEREPMARRDSGRWGEGGGGDASAAAAAGSRAFAEPHNPAWTDAPATRGGRGRGTEIDSWKPRGDAAGGGEWRSSTADAGSAGGGGWRTNDRWGSTTAPGVARHEGSWRAGGGGAAGASRFGPAEPSMDGSRGFGMGRGRGRTGAGLIGGIGAAERGGANFRSFGSGGGVGGRMRWGASKAGRRYTTDELARAYKQMLYSGRLRLPAGVERDDPLLFLGQEEFVDVVEQLMGVDPAAAAQAFADHYALLRSYSHRSLGGGGEESGSGAAVVQRQHSALAGDVLAQPAAPPPPADEWCYKDPQGVIQGPFARTDIIDWYEAGYFPLDLQVRAAGEPADAPFKPLAALLKSWNKPVGPPGFAAAAAAAEPELVAPDAALLEPAAVLGEQPLASLPVDLPEADDLLSASLHHLDLAGSVGVDAAPAPVPAPGPGPASEDPVVDPSMLRRAAPGAHLIPQPAAAPLSQAPSLGGPLAQLPLGGPLAQLQAMGSGHLGHHPDLLAAAAGHFQAQHPHAGLLPQPDLFGQQQHLLAPHHAGLGVGALPPAPLPHQQQQFAPAVPEQQGAAALPSWLTEPAATPAAAPAPEPVPQQPAPAAQQPPAPAKVAPTPAAAAPAPARPSLLDIQREQAAQEAEARRRAQAEAERRAAVEAEEEARRAREAELLYQQAAASAALDGVEEEAESQAAAARPETKVAPWAAAAVPKKKTSKTLLEIQQEEAERAARAAAEEAAAAAAAPPGAAPMGGWAKAARGKMSGGSLSLREIQEEEERQRAVAAVAAAEAAEALARAESINGLASRSAAAGGWSSSAGASGAPSLREVMQSEAAAVTSSRSSSVAPAAADDDDSGLFWDYGVQPGAKPAPPAPAAAPASRKAAAPAPKSGGWATAVAATTPGVIPAAPVPARPAAAAPAARPAPAPAARAAPAAAPYNPAPAPAFQLDEADAAAIAAALTDSSSSALSGAFRSWCQEQMQELTGSPDVTLCEFLLTVESNSELAEYCTLYLGASPAVSRFASEFMKRKLAEAAAASKSSRSRKNKSKAAATAAAAAPAAAARAAPAPVAGPPGYAPPAAAFPTLGTSAAQPAKKDTDWEKVPKTAGGKKKKKGAKLDAGMLGFASGTNYALLEQPE